MKYLTVILAALLLAACDLSEQPSELPITETNLNAQWCRLCEKDGSYSYCKYLEGKCGDTQIKLQPEKPINTMDPVEIPETESEAIEGREVRIRAQAFHDMCTREYNELLCPEEYKK